MAKPIRSSPNVKEGDYWRANENWRNSVTKALTLVGTRTIDVPSVAAFNRQTFTVTVVGARPDIGQTVDVGPPSTFPTGTIAWGYVSAKDTLTVVISNITGSLIDPPLGLYGVRVFP